MSVSCDYNCASCMEECENRTVFINNQLDENYQKGICQTGKFPQAKRFEKVSVDGRDWRRQGRNLLDEIVEEEDVCEALKFAIDVFMDCEAKDHTAEGIKFFTKTLQNPEYFNHLRIYAAKENGKWVGMGATRSSGTQLALLYVSKEKQRQGIGSALFECILQDDPMEEMQVHSSPDAISFYKSIGFEAIGEMMEENGIRFMPMRFSRKRI